MERILIALLALGLCILPGHIFSAASSGGGAEGTLIFLDLPDGFGVSEEEEDEPEFIEFYNTDYEGDAFFFCLDRSSSMGQASSSGQTKFVVLKRETIKAIQALSSRSVVSIAFYDGTGAHFIGDPPMKMDAAGKAAVVAFITATNITSGSCMTNGTDKLFQIVPKTKNEHKVMVITADGRVHCNGTEDPERVYGSIMAKNVLRIPINTVYTGQQSGDDWTKGKTLLERISRGTNGKFTIAR